MTARPRPSLQGFVNQLRAGDVEIKRDMEQERDEVRIMTVHGAKGLQAPIVFLPDTCMGPRPQGPRLYPVARAGEPARRGQSSRLAAHGTFRRSPGSPPPRPRWIRPSTEEYHRLLYVAMTRAKDRLYVCGWQGVKGARARRAGTTSSRGPPRPSHRGRGS